MGKLILSFEGTVLKSVAVGKDRISIGRKPENDIQVDNLAVSGFHAAVMRDGNDVVLEDLNSTNGTIVNGHLVQKHVLKNFDVIELGKHKLKYLSEAVVSPVSMDKTMVMRRPILSGGGKFVPGTRGAAEPAPDAVSGIGAEFATNLAPNIATNMAPDAPSAIGLATPLQTVPAVPPPAPPPTTPTTSTTTPTTPLPEAALQVISGAASGRILDLTKSLTKVGRAGVQVSVITRRPNGYFITHVEGTDFPLLNGNMLGAQATQLNDQDTIEIAGTKMSFFYKH